MALEAELATYHARKAELLAAHGEGGYAVIQGDRVLGVYPTYETALEAGYREFGLEGWMVKQIWEVEPVLWFPWGL